MTPKDQLIAESLLTRSIALMRFTATERGNVLRILRQMEEELVELLVYSGKPLTAITREDKARLLKQAQESIERLYGETSEVMAETMREVGRIEAAAIVASLDKAFQGMVAPNMPTEAKLKRMADNTLIEGAPSADWWKRQAGDTVFRFKAALQQGLAQGESNAQIIQRVRGTANGFTMVEGKRVYNYTGGFMDALRSPKGGIASLVQTSIMAAGGAARMDTYQANDDVIKGLKQLSTLDSHTSQTCLAYSGGHWKMDEARTPVAPTTLPFISPKGSASGCPRHFSCRSLITPETKTFRELGIDLPEFPGTTRSASGGPVAADMSFDAFIKRKGDAFADDLLGPGRAQLWRDKKITLTQLLDQNGRPLTLKELKRLYAR
jgi:hypothetical protein